MGREQVGAESRLLRFRGRIRMGVSRVTNLAAVLEALAEVEGSSRRTAIGDCLGGDALVDSGGGFRFIWECDPATVVDADPDRVQRAIRTLAHLGKADSAIGSDLAFSVGRTASE